MNFAIDFIGKCDGHAWDRGLYWFDFLEEELQ